MTKLTIVKQPAPPKVVKPKTRIQQDREEKILNGAVEIFAQQGQHGATLDQIALHVGMSKPNLLYYYKSKQEIYMAVLQRTLKLWLDPLHSLAVENDPAKELTNYIRAKVNFSFQYPLESKVYAMEIIQGAQSLKPHLEGELKKLVEDKTQVLREWAATGKINNIEPMHIIFMIWASTQHYADFFSQIEALVKPGTSKEDIRKKAITSITQVILKGILV